jgi:hypothetical protein
MPHLHISVPHVEKLAYFLVLLLPIFPLTSLGTIQGGLATSAALELKLRRRFGSAEDAALRHVAVGVECGVTVTQGTDLFFVFLS